jgi:hypothetical protein
MLYLVLVPVEPLQLQDADGRSSCLASDQPTTDIPFPQMTFPFYLGRFFYAEARSPSKLRRQPCPLRYYRDTHRKLLGSLFDPCLPSQRSVSLLFFFARPPTRGSEFHSSLELVGFCYGFRFCPEVAPRCPIFWAIVSCRDSSSSWSRDLEPI